MRKLATFCLGMSTLMFASMGHAEGDDPWSSALTKRDIQMRAVTGWDYQPGQASRNLHGTQQQAQPQDQTKIPSDVVQQSTAPVWEKPRPPVEAVSDPSMEPHSQTSFDVGFQFFRYNYQEPDPSVVFDAYKYGFTGEATVMLTEDWLMRLDGRFAFGDGDYKGSGTKKGNPDRLFEIKATTGWDVMFGRFAVTPFAGIGYRNLFNDCRGASSTGAKGYRRESQYLFLPMGMQPRYQIEKDELLSMNIEVDPVLQGWQFSQLSDAGFGDTDVVNKQASGFGARGEVMYHYDRLSLGPFFNYWNIDQSNFARCDAFMMCLVEPRNRTIEYGIQARASLY
jgi:hypothetical protein